MKYFKKISFLLCCVLSLCFSGCKPVVTINAPANGDTFEVGATITFEGEATDPQHPNLADDAFVWTSDKDGEIGTGASFTTADLSAGEHTITLTVTDPDGQSGQRSVTITVGNGNVTTTTIAATGDRFQDNGNGTVTDTRTTLIWLKNANPCGDKNWYEAVAYCSSLASGTAGLTDGSTAGQWRLPSIQELEGIGTDPPTTYCLDGLCAEPTVTWTMPGAPFTDVLSSYYYWSGTSSAYNTDYAWYVYMGGGFVTTSSKRYSIDFYYVWPVRGGN